MCVEGRWMCLFPLAHPSACSLGIMAIFQVLFGLPRGDIATAHHVGWGWWHFSFLSCPLCSLRQPFAASSLTKINFLLSSLRNEGGKQVTAA